MTTEEFKSKWMPYRIQAMEDDIRFYHKQFGVPLKSVRIEVEYEV